MEQRKKVLLISFSTILVVLLASSILYFSKKGTVGITEIIGEKITSLREIPKTDENIPYYFIAIHNEPHNISNGENILKDDYTRLQDMVKKSDEYNIKLTIMLSAQWAKYIIENGYQDEIEGWMKNGHEIAVHHHSEYHGNWDGYSNNSYEEVKTYRDGIKLATGDYYGTLDDFINELQKLNPDIHSGCINDEKEKDWMMDEIVYDTCSGFANSGTVGTRSDDVKADKGLNEFVLVGEINGIERKWLGHHMITTADLETSAEEAFLKLDSSAVYGTVNHSLEKENEFFYKYLEFLHTQNPDGSNSRTLSEVIDQKLLPEKEISTEMLLEEYGGATSYDQTQPQNGKTLPPLSGKCGDGICDQLEKNNPNLCPKDCQ